MAKQPFEDVVHYLFQVAAQAEFKLLNDQELLKRYVQYRDEMAFGELVRRHKAMVWRVCWRVLRHHQDVEDAFQATVMMLMRRAKTILSRETIEGWLHRTALTVASNSKVARVRRRAREERSAEMSQENHERNEALGELSETLDRELTHIPEKYRSPLLLCYLEGMTQKEAAQRLGLSIDALEQRLRRGRQYLKQRLSKHGMEWEHTIMMAHPAHGVHVPEVPPDLMERTLDMVRIMALSNGALETAVISPHVALLVKGAMGMTLKTKVLLGSLLLSTLMIVTAGAAKFTGIMHLSLGTPRQEPKIQIPEEPKSEKTPSRLDRYGDPLPPGALARLGTVRFRGNERDDQEVVFTADSQAVGLILKGRVPRLWNMKTGVPVGQFGEGLRGGRHAGSCLSLDGRRMAYAQESWDNKLGRVGEYKVQEVATGKLICSFEATNKDLRFCCALSPDGKSLLGHFSGGLRLMDIATGQPIWTHKLKSQDAEGLWSLLFAPDGKTVAVAYKRHNANKIELRDGQTGKPLRLVNHASDLEDYSFSPDSQTLVVVYAAGGEAEPAVYLWDVATAKERWHLKRKNHSFRHPSFSPNSKTIALHEWITGNPEIGLYEVATGNKLGSCEEHDLTAGGRLVFSPDGKVLASLQKSVLRCWDVSSGKILTPPAFGHESNVCSLAFAADAKILISGGCNEAVHIWNGLTGQKQRSLNEESCLRSMDALNFAPYSFDFRALAASADGTIVAAASFEFPRTDEKNIVSLASQDILEALIESIRVKIRIWDAATGRELHKIEWDSSKGIPQIRKLVFSPNGKFLAVWWVRAGGAFDNVSIWEVATGKQIVKRILGARPIFSPDSTHLMTNWKSHKNDVFTIWETATGKKVSTLEPEVKFEGRQITVTPDWQTLVGVVCYESSAKAAWDKKCRWYLNSLHLDKQFNVSLGQPRYFGDFNTGSLKQPGDRAQPNLVAVSRDARTMAWIEFGNENIVRVMETATGADRFCFKGHNGRITSLVFSADGRRLATGSEDTSVLVWDLTGGFVNEQGQLRSTRLTDQQMQRLWNALGTLDSVQPGRAIWTMVSAPKQTVAFLVKHLAPIALKEHASPQKIAQFIAELDHEKYAIRHQAEVALAKLGGSAEQGIRTALKDKTLSEGVRRRLKQMLVAIQEERIQAPSGEVLRSIRAIEILERIGTPEARRFLDALAQGAPGFRQTREAQAALQRLQQTSTQQ